jgi:hypothetical protein
MQVCLYARYPCRCLQCAVYMHCTHPLLQACSNCYYKQCAPRHNRHTCRHTLAPTAHTYTVPPLAPPATHLGTGRGSRHWQAGVPGEPAPQSQKNLLWPLYTTSWPAWHVSRQALQQPLVSARPQV